jgi:peroxiredoxin Q/BCP
MASVDTLEDNTGFAKKESADFPILSDPAKETARKYGILSERGFANR